MLLRGRGCERVKRRYTRFLGRPAARTDEDTASLVCKISVLNSVCVEASIYFGRSEITGLAGRRDKLGDLESALCGERSSDATVRPFGK